MCAPTFRGAAYLAASIFVYRSIQLVLNAIACGITDYKMTYLNVPYLEEFMLNMIYFVPLFTGGGFALMGLDEESFNFVFYATLSLTTTLFIRYAAELSYIYAYDWSAFRLKTPSLILNILVDSIFLVILLIYAYKELRDPVKKKERLINTSRGSSPYRRTGNVRCGTAGTSTPGSPGTLLSSTPTNTSNIRNVFERKNVKNSNIEAVCSTSSFSYGNKPKAGQATARKGIGGGSEPGEALHYPITPVEKELLMKPLPPLPAGTPHDSEFDDISLPPHIPLASPDYDDV